MLYIIPWYLQVREKQVEKLLPGVRFCRLATGAMALWCAVGALGEHCVLSEKAAVCMENTTSYVKTAL